MRIRKYLLKEEFGLKELKSAQKDFMKEFRKVTVGITKGKKGLGLFVTTDDKRLLLSLPTEYKGVPVYKRPYNEIVMENVNEERSDYSTDHLQDAIRHIRNGIEDMYELFDDIEDKKGMIQANKMKKEWKALEKMAKPFVYNMDKIHQFRDELKNGGPITKPVAEPAEKPIEKQIEEHLNRLK